MWRPVRCGQPYFQLVVEVHRCGLWLNNLARAALIVGGGWAFGIAISAHVNVQAKYWTDLSVAVLGCGRVGATVSVKGMMTGSEGDIVASHGCEKGRVRLRKHGLGDFWIVCKSRRKATSTVFDIDTSGKASAVAHEMLTLRGRFSDGHGRRATLRTWLLRKG